MKELQANIVDKPNGIHKNTKVFYVDELLVLKERYTDEELQQLWNDAFRHIMNNDTTTESKENKA